MAKGRANGHTLGSVALIGAHPGVGVSTLAASLKTALDGRFSSRTVVIKFDDDADAVPSTGAVLELQASTTRGVRCLPAGVSEKEMTNLARQLVAGETAPDMVLFDITAKPGSNETFAREAARKSSAADYRLLVVEAGRTKLGTVRELAREFDRTGLPIHGLILNKRKRPLPAFLSDKN
jgi:Mrp family chromosome partitioning ATPase